MTLFFTAIALTITFPFTSMGWDSSKTELDTVGSAGVLPSVLMV